MERDDPLAPASRGTRMISTMDAYLDLLDEAVGWINSDDLLEARNDAMREFLEVCGDGNTQEGGGQTHSVLDLPFSAADQAMVSDFLAGDSDTFQAEMSLSVATGEICIRMAIHRESGDGFSVVIQDLTESRRWMARALRGERLRVVGALGEGLIHDLNNVMGSMIGAADYLAEATADDETREFMHTVIDGTRSRGQILKSLYQFLHDQRVSRVRVNMRSLIDDIENIFRKTALQANIGFEMTYADELPDVRIVPEHVLHAVLSIFGHSIESEAGPITVEITSTTLGQEGGPSRPHVVMRILDHGQDWSIGEFDRWHELDSFCIDAGTQSLLLAVTALHVHGGQVEAGREPDGRRHISLYLPCLPARVQD